MMKFAFSPKCTFLPFSVFLAFSVNVCCTVLCRRNITCLHWSGLAFFANNLSNMMQPPALSTRVHTDGFGGGSAAG